MKLFDLKFGKEVSGRFLLQRGAAQSDWEDKIVELQRIDEGILGFEVPNSNDSDLVIEVESNSADAKVLMWELQSGQVSILGCIMKAAAQEVEIKGQAFTLPEAEIPVQLQVALTDEFIETVVMRQWSKVKTFKDAKRCLEREFLLDKFGYWFVNSGASDPDLERGFTVVGADLALDLTFTDDKRQLVAKRIVKHRGQNLDRRPIYLMRQSLEFCDKTAASTIYSAAIAALDKAVRENNSWIASWKHYNSEEGRILEERFGSLPPLRYQGRPKLKSDDSSKTLLIFNLELSANLKPWVEHISGDGLPIIIESDGGKPEGLTVDCDQKNKRLTVVWESDNEPPSDGIISPSMALEESKLKKRDNAIAGMSLSGLPVDRLGGKKGEDRGAEVIQAWGDQVIKVVRSHFKNEPFATRTLIDQLKGSLSHWRTSAGGREGTREIILAFRNAAEQFLSAQRIAELDRLAATVPTVQTQPKPVIEDAEDREELERRLNQQCTAEENFKDDGNRQARRLRRFLEPYLDNLSPEIMLHPASHALAGYATCEEFGVLLNDLTYKNHQSQIIITCREKPSNLADSRYEGSQPDSELVHLETLGGVSIESGIKILQQRHLTDSDEDLEWIAQSVDGHVFLLTQLAAIAKGKPGYLRKHPELVTKNAAKLLKVQFERQSEEGRELLQRICILREPINTKGLTFLRLYTDDWIKEDCLIKPCELEKKYKTSDVEIDKTELIITRLVDNCLVESYYDEQECEHYYGLHRVIKEFLQKELINNLPALLQRVYCYYKAAKNIYDTPKSIEELYPSLEAQYLYFYLGDYSEVYKLLNSNAKKYLKRWGYWRLLQELYEKILPCLSGFELSECLHSLGEIYFDFGNWELAEKCFNMALSIAREQGYENLEEMSTLSLQLIDNERQSWDLEEQSYQLRMQSQHENYDQGRMQDFYQFLDDYNRQAWGVKAESYKKQLQFYAESPSFPDLEINITETTGNLGEAEFYIGNFESAEKILEEALAKMQELCMVKHIALTNYRLAKLKYRCGNIKMAEAHYNIACQIYLNLGALKELEKIEREWRRM